MMKPLVAIYAWESMTGERGREGKWIVISLEERFSAGTFSCWAFLFEFQQNSKIATTMAIAKPHRSTTNTPPVGARKQELCNHPRYEPATTITVPMHERKKSHHNLYKIVFKQTDIFHAQGTGFRFFILVVPVADISSVLERE